ncbi:NfeD-like C-terminal, partner-binding [Ekhidna lutea]|uniref:NfeD-like C-terminal, partner-binding n=1 Tax=Ekhidna lutea TaxID=447679 RepID=A0A239ITJ6_EKHLU|nr:NfeD family protein [Ekhidna lutea]SNS96950.1 NfeD-like C-terminal, partner-binding [Ekhidna lutea]
MEWFTIISLILVGAFLVIAEILFIPGIFIAGTLGVLCSIYGVYLSFEYFDSTTGTIVLILAVIVNVLSLVLAFRGKTWERFSLQQSHESKVNQDFKHSLKLGDKGRTISTLKPIGKAIFNDVVIEVRSKGNYVDENVEIEIEKIDNTRIFVKPI